MNRIAAPVLYFAYGSNMAVERLRARVMSARLLGIARLQGHALRFHKPGSRDGTGKCDAFFTGRAGDTVHGALYAIDASDWPVLDACEARGHGYDRRMMSVLRPPGDAVDAQTYIATMHDPSLRPLDWYKQHVLRGARALGLPPDYLASIEAIAADADHDAARRERELSIYDAQVVAK